MHDAREIATLDSRPAGPRNAGCLRERIGIVRDTSLYCPGYVYYVPVIGPRAVARVERVKRMRAQSWTNKEIRKEKKSQKWREYIQLIKRLSMVSFARKSKSKKRRLFAPNSIMSSHLVVSPRLFASFARNEEKKESYNRRTCARFVSGHC